MYHANNPKKRAFSAKESGFTIIELLIATVVFSIVLLVILTAFIRTSDLFYKGVSMNNTQEAARNVTESIENDIKFSSSPPPNLDVVNPAQSQFCIGNHRYRYWAGEHVGTVNGDYGIVRDTISVSSGCPDTSSVPATSQIDQLLGPGMQVNHLKIDCSGGSRCIVSIHLIYYGGSSDGLFAPSVTDANAQCTGDLNSSQICATADFNRTVLING